ncbi:TPA: hypothetical protein ACTZ1F_002828 [Bacillus cereus]|uniref:hypothetical protein n=1 Tax=Bacillus cereus group TaxID=86661 RepID=UPI00016B7C2D|nr:MULTISPECIES: hypothetical protein [Bacillus cereus group]ACI30546.1 hypothetical protein BCH308197_B0070 [Bacillus cereus H3081.97]AKR38733.1 Hypothetical protein NF53_p4085 [Bacillus thuringiensis serovar indiana]OTY74348.1 hypothetical protein BK753_00150 [Bacillus thuringiensis serovar canadensis]MBG9641222.1 hypothetical protein [Bacillus thuringiensis]MBG9647992.1 hypothetical protein [Bacillus thuringiensis]
MSKLKARTFIITYQIEDHNEVQEHTVKAFSEKNITIPLEEEVKRRFKKKCKIIAVSESKSN